MNFELGRFLEGFLKKMVNFLWSLIFYVHCIVNTNLTSSVVIIFDVDSRRFDLRSKNGYYTELQNAVLFLCFSEYDFNQSGITVLFYALSLKSEIPHYSQSAKIIISIGCKFIWIYFDQISSFILL